MSVYAWADAHGCYWAWKKIKEILQPEDKLYFLGDANDRGEDGWILIKELLNDNRVTYLKGNHEQMFLDNWGNYNGHNLDDNETYGMDDRLWSWYSNGGLVTENQFVMDSINPEEKVNYLHQLKNLPFLVVYHNQDNKDIYLCHAGCNYKDLNNLSEEDALWDRYHYLNDSWDGPNNSYIIHGHTPIPIMLEQQEQFSKFYDMEIHIPNKEMWEGAYWYADEHKCCIDCGTVFTDQTVLLNLDTFEEIVINKE